MNEFIAPHFPSFGRTEIGERGSWPQAADTIVIKRIGDSFNVEWHLGGKQVAVSLAKAILSGDSLRISTKLMPS